MWKLLKFVGLLCKMVFWLFFTVFVLVVAVLYICSRNIPAPLVDQVCARLSNDNLHVQADKASVSLRHGLRVTRIRVVPSRVTPKPVLNIDELVVGISLRNGFSPASLIRSVSMKGLSIPDLPPASLFEDEDKGLKQLPIVNAFPVDLTDVNILGIRAHKISAMLGLSEQEISLFDLLVKWHHRPLSQGVEGYATVDLRHNSVEGRAHGFALPSDILPLLYVLQAAGGIEQVELFTGVANSVGADFFITADIKSGDFDFTLDLDVGPCFYRGVPVEYAKGRIHAAETNITTVVRIEPLKAKSTSGTLSGSLIYQDPPERIELSATASMDPCQLLDIINLLNQGELDRFQFTSSVNVKAAGMVVVKLEEQQVTNALTGRITCESLRALNLPLKKLSADLSVKGHTASLSKLDATPDNGGKISGLVDFAFPEYNANATVFSSELLLEKVSLNDLSQAFNVTNTRVGTVNCSIALEGPVHEDTIAFLNGKGNVIISDGVLHRMQLFAGFTDYLARNIPGMASMVNLSTCTMDFTIKKGVLHTRNLLIEGSLFSIKGSGSYNLHTDELDFTIRANIFRKRTVAGRISHFLALPFSRMLLEFKVFGKLEDPQWSYVSIIERITDSFSDNAASGVTNGVNTGSSVIKNPKSQK